MREQRQSALRLYRWTDDEEKRCVQVRGQGEHTHRNSHHKISCFTSRDLLMAFSSLMNSQHHRETSRSGFYSARGLLGVICLLACSSSWRAQRKDLTLSGRREKITEAVQMMLCLQGNTKTQLQGVFSPNISNGLRNPRSSGLWGQRRYWIKLCCWYLIFNWPNLPHSSHSMQRQWCNSWTTTVFCEMKLWQQVNSGNALTVAHVQQQELALVSEPMLLPAAASAVLQ